MTNNKSFKNFLQIVRHPKVVIFMLVGIGIIFLTFLTDNNALEIAISGIASVFIGIAVNNFSIIDTHQTEENKLKPKIAHSLEMMYITINKIKRIQAEINGNDYIKNELTELEQYMRLAVELIKEAELT
ncbi:MAG: hypothetical protein ABI288_09470 [Ginsengibacter sp.]